MGCERWGAKLDTYFDGELPADESRALADHLRTCASCATDSVGRVQEKLAIRAAGQKYRPDPAFHARVEAMVRARKRPGWFRSMPAAAVVAAMLVGAAILLFRTNEGRDEQRLLSELVDLHVATLASANPVDVVSTDRHTVKPWFEGKIPFTFNLPELEGSGFVLVGGRVVYLNQSSGAELIFRVRQHQVSLFIFPEQAFKDSAPTTTTGLSFGVRSWSRNGLGYVLVGDVAGQDLDKLRELIQGTG
jgi:anti-sigma factor RsiW